MTQHLSNNDLDDSSIALPGGFAFVMNVGQFPPHTSHVLSNGHVFRRATSNEIEIIDQTVRDFSASPHNLTMRRFWKRRLPWPGQSDELLPTEEWRYFVIAFKEPEAHLIDLFQAASDISPKEIEIGFTITYEKNDGLMNHSHQLIPTRFFQVLRSTDWDPAYFINIEPSDLDYISSTYSQLTTYDPQSYPPAYDIKNVTLSDLNHLKSLPHWSHLRFLGYFGILESLLTHAPKPMDPYDSITRQVKRKLALLDNRWAPKLDYAPFGAISADKIWGKMYGLRSRIAHGDRTVASNSELNYEHAFVLLKQAVKATLRYTLTDARLLVDLREC